MGLDIYFWKRVRTENDNKEYENHRKEMVERYKFNDYHMLINDDKVIKIGYFRKVNFLMGVFDKEQTGEYIKIDKYSLESLLDLCNTVLKSKDIRTAEKYLPPQSGFFFGCTDINDYYFSDVEDVADWLETILPKLDDEDVIYFEGNY